MPAVPLATFRGGQPGGGTLLWDSCRVLRDVSRQTYGFAGSWACLAVLRPSAAVEALQQRAVCMSQIRRHPVSWRYRVSRCRCLTGTQLAHIGHACQRSVSTAIPRPTTASKRPVLRVTRPLGAHLLTIWCADVCGDKSPGAHASEMLRHSCGALLGLSRRGTSPRVAFAAASSLARRVNRAAFS